MTKIPPVPESEFPRFERVVAWQEKIFSRAEATARARSSGAETELDRKYDAMVRDGNLTGETIYTYVAADRFADDRDAEKTVTTSATERVNGLFRAVFGSPAARVVAANARGRDATAKRTELARGRRRRGGALPVTFVICADCGPLELPPDHPALAGGDDELTRRREGEEILMTIEAFPDGSVAISPDFCQESDGEPYRVERRDGSVWEYGVTNASTRDETPLEKRQKDIAPTAAMRAMQLARRRRAGPGAFVPPPADAAERLVFLGEIVSGRGFEHDRLYCEWALEYDKELWFVESPAGGDQTSAPEPVVAGATQISKTTVYPSDALSGDETLSGSGDGFFSSERLVAHWSAPIELCLVARRAPAPREYPVIFFQVSSYDAWDRYRPEGYGALSLRPHDQTGARAREVRTWRAGGTIRDRIATHYVGGAPEIGNLSYVAAPAFGAEGDAGSQKVHSRLGFVADASGVIAVRAHAMTQRPKALSAGARKGVSALRGVLAKGKGLGFGGPGARDQTSLGGGEALDVDDDAENAAPGNGSARGDSDQTEDVVARARARASRRRGRRGDSTRTFPREPRLSRGARARRRRRRRARRRLRLRRAPKPPGRRPRRRRRPRTTRDVTDFYFFFREKNRKPYVSLIRYAR
jgi:Meckel syndrome type 1 protein